MNVDGTGETELSPTGYHDDENPAWSPDGMRIAFDNGFWIYTMRSDGSDRKAVVPRGESREPDWSPDGRRLAFIRVFYDSAGEGVCAEELVAVNADGSGEQQLTGSLDHCASDNRIRNPAWSPDGKRIALNAGRLETIAADGSDQRVVSNEGIAQFGQLDWQFLPGLRRGDYKNAAKFCKAEQHLLGTNAFRQRYDGGANAYGKCVSEE